MAKAPRIITSLMCVAGTVFVAFGATVAGLVAGLVVGSVVLGTGHLCAVVGQQALVANTTRSARMDAAFGYYTFAASLGQAVGPLLIVLFRLPGLVRALVTSCVVLAAVDISLVYLPALGTDRDIPSGVIGSARPRP